MVSHLVSYHLDSGESFGKLFVYNGESFGKLFVYNSESFGESFGFGIALFIA